MKYTPFLCPTPLGQSKNYDKYDRWKKVTKSSFKGDAKPE